jgi:hypothetical protein
MDGMIFIFEIGLAAVDRASIARGRVIIENLDDCNLLE